METKEKALHALSDAGCYWMVNWKMVQELGGMDEAILLGYLCSMQARFGDDNGVFYRTIPDMKRDTLLDVRRQRKALKALSYLGLIEMYVMGMPKKRYFRVCAERVKEFLHEISVSQQYSANSENGNASIFYTEQF